MPCPSWRMPPSTCWQWVCKEMSRQNACALRCACYSMRPWFCREMFRQTAYALTCACYSMRPWFSMLNARTGGAARGRSARLIFVVVAVGLLGAVVVELGDAH